MADPVFILAPGRSFTSIVCGMIGEHPDLYGVPELNLPLADTMEEWWALYWTGETGAAHGLLRTVAQVYFGEQTPTSIRRAARWLRRRSSWDTGELFRQLADDVQPATLVEKSPLIVADSQCLTRLGETFPGARFIHLARHPRTTGHSLLATGWTRYWFLHRARSYDFGTAPPTLDPQRMWCDEHMRIMRFLRSLPESRSYRVRGEDLLSDPESYLASIAQWLGVAADADSVGRMTHPERSTFASVGPPGARYGNDPSFLKSPYLRPYREDPPTLDGPLDWRRDGAGFSSETKLLARELGYK